MEGGLDCEVMFELALVPLLAPPKVEEIALGSVLLLVGVRPPALLAVCAVLLPAQSVPLQGRNLCGQVGLDQLKALGDLPLGLRVLFVPGGLGFGVSQLLLQGGHLVGQGVYWIGVI